MNVPTWRCSVRPPLALCCAAVLGVTAVIAPWAIAQDVANTSLIVGSVRRATLETGVSQSYTIEVDSGFFISGAANQISVDVVVTATVTGCTFTDNLSVHDGGGMAILGGSPVVIGCTFTGNTALSGGGMLTTIGSSPIVINCILHGNTASEGGGGMFNFGSCPTLINCTITQNFDGPVGGGGIFNDGFNSTVTLVVLNCVLWDNFENQIREVGENSDTTVLYSNIQGGWPGLGNINALPLFVDPDNGDLRLEPGSPCIDAGDDTAVPKGVLRDLDGHPRFVDDACSGHAGPVVDIGAFEFQGTSCDLGNVMAIVAAWGSCSDCGTPQACPADFDGDCSVGGLDLLWLLRELVPERIVPTNGNFRWGRPPRASQ